MTKLNRDDVITDITIKLKNIRDTDPNDLTFSVSNTSFIEKRADGVYYIKENIPVNTTIGSVTIIERDEATPPNYSKYQVFIDKSTKRKYLALLKQPGNKFLVSNALDYESRTTGYETIEIRSPDLKKFFFRKFFNYKIVNVHEKTINIANQVRSVSENAEIGASVGAVITATGDTTITSYSIVSGNNEGIFSIDNNGQITINDNSKLDYETTQTYFINVKVSGEDADDKTAKITINIDNITENIC
jgi:Tfp pilus tip-associated adhesin PilY1